jgi:hypothetical protein
MAPQMALQTEHQMALRMVDRMAHYQKAHHLGDKKELPMALHSADQKEYQMAPQMALQMVLHLDG